MLIIKHLIFALFLMNGVAFANTDADTFFLLDTDEGCISLESLEADTFKTYQQSKDLIEEDAFVVFKYDPNYKSDIQDISTLQQKVEDFFKDKHGNLAKAYNEQLLKKITPQSLINILKSALDDDALLDDITKRSYIHVMGFTKIVLLTGEKGNEYKVRLHLWWPDQISGPTQLVLEDKHFHKWSFASKMFSGSFEDQLYLVSDVRKEEENTYKKFMKEVQILSDSEQKKVFDSLKIIEMAMYGKTKFQHPKFSCSVNKKDIYTKAELMRKFNLNEKNFLTILSVHERYITKPNIDGIYNLEKTGLVHLSFPVIYDIQEGLGYFHHHSLGHRLIFDPDEMVATLVITAPPIEHVEPYILMRSQEGEDITKVAPYLKKEMLIEQIQRFVKLLEEKI